MGRPIVLVPGFSGSILVKPARPYRKILNKTLVNNRWLQLNSKQWNLDNGASFKPEGSGHGLVLHGDLVPHHVGGLDGIRNICRDLHWFSSMFDMIDLTDRLDEHFNFTYFDSLINALESDGAVPTADLFGFPYDFRFVLDPEVKRQTFANLRFVIETAVRKNKGAVVMVCHSQGALVVKWFLNEMPLDWTRHHVHKFVAINAPFSGVPHVLHILKNGDHYIKPMRKWLLENLRFNTGLVMMMPPIEESELIRCDLEGVARLRRELYEPQRERIEAPLQVPSIVIHSELYRETVAQIEFNDDGDCIETIGMGDGVVPNHSILAYEQSLPMTEALLTMNASHGLILQHPDFIDAIRSIRV